MDLITTAEACRRLGLAHRSSLSRYVREGRIQATSIGGRHFYDPAEVERFRAERGNGDAA